MATIHQAVGRETERNVEVKSVIAGGAVAGLIAGIAMAVIWMLRTTSIA